MVRAEGLFKRFGRQVVLEGIDLALAAGEFAALLGPNGAGKSTLLKAIVGLVRPDRGRIAVAGHDVACSRRRALEQLGFVPQRVGFAGFRSVREVLGFHARLKRVGPEAVARALERTGLTRVAERRVQELSGGTVQRLGLAQALLASPPLLVLDEPTVGLDPTIAAEFRALLAQLNREGVTVLLSSHLLGEVERLASRVVVLKQGAIAAQGSPAELLERTGLRPQLALVVPGQVEAARRVLEQAGFAVTRQAEAVGFEPGPDGGVRALGILREAGIEPRALRACAPGLEDAYERIVGGT